MKGDVDTYPVEIAPSAPILTATHVELSLAVVNHADRTLLVTDEVRRVAWDPTTRRLELWLCDELLSAEPGRRCHAVSVPHTTEIRRGDTRSIPVRVARTLWRLTPRVGRDPDIERLDLGNVEDVVVHVAVTDTPFYLVQGGPPPLEQLARWGQRHVARCSMKR